MAEDLLKKLVEAPSISGSEKNVRDLMQKALKPHVDSIKVDKIGNLIAVKGKGSPKIMIASHMDELGLMVKFIEKDGFIRFDTVGGWDERLLPGLKVWIHGTKGSVFGVIGTKAIHIQEKDEQKKPFRVKDLFVDIGADSSGDVEKAGISVGDFVTHHGQLRNLRGSKITGHGFDNRLGCYAMIEIMKKAKGFKGTLYGVGTVQEEIGLIGARGSAFGIDPDVLLAVDTSIAGGTPGISNAEAPLKIGKGPALVLKDAYSFINPKVKRWINATARKFKVPLQKEVTSGGATDAAVAPMVKEGIPGGSLGIPTRYVHTPVEVADINDVNNMVKLVVGAVKTAKDYF